MRSKKAELTDAVVRAARDYVAADADISSWRPPDLDPLRSAVAALDALAPAEVSGAARWAEGSDTSQRAAAMAWPLQKSTRYAIIATVHHCPPVAQPGYTDWQLEQRLKASHQTVSSARNWLCEAGWLEDSGVRRIRNGRPATVWQLTAAARLKISQQPTTH